MNMDLSKIYSKTSEFASSAAKTSRKFIHQAKDFIDDSSSSISSAIGNPQLGGTNPSIQSQSQVEMPPNMRINGMDISFIRLLDEGGFSYVFEAVDTRTGTPLAVKRLIVQDAETAKLVRMEIKIMQDLKNHPNIIHLFGTLEQMEGSKRVFYIVMEKASMSLIQLMQDRLDQGKRFSLNEIFNIFHSICSGVESLHRMEPPVQHRDLKVENVLRAGNSFKLCDFGSCTTRVYSLDSKQERSIAEEDISKNTTLAYRSPEMCDLFSEYPITEKSDIWALGCILFKLCYFIGPFDEAAAEGSSLSIINCKYVIPKDSKIPSEILSLIKDMLEINVEKRLDIWEVLDRVAKLRGVENPITRPNRLQTQIVKPRSTSNIKVKPRNKKEDLFDLLGGPEEISNSNINVKPKISTTKKELNQTVSTQKLGFEDSDDWEANFDDDFGSDPFKLSTSLSSKSSTPKSSHIPTPTTGTPHKESLNLFDELNWEAPKSNTNSLNNSINNTKSTTSNSIDIDFSGLTIHSQSSTPSSRDSAKQNILFTLDQSQSQGQFHNRVNSFDMSTINRPHTPQSPSVYNYYTPPSSPYPQYSGFPSGMLQPNQAIYPMQQQQYPQYPQQSVNHYPSQYVQQQQYPQPSQSHLRTYSQNSQPSSPYPSTTTNPFDQFF